MKPIARDPMFIDLFAGCGGISLGLMNAGLTGCFAIEKDWMAFETLRHNLVQPTRHAEARFDWPDWLTVKAHEISASLRLHRKDLAGLRGRIALIAGGPPCQGFSLAGKRHAEDPRNNLFRQYLNVIDLVQPDLLLLENVKGITIEFGKKHRMLDKRPNIGCRPVSFADRIIAALTQANPRYVTFAAQLRAVDFGVPQLRPRFILIGVRSDLAARNGQLDPFEFVERERIDFLKKKGLSRCLPVSVQDAISDLEVKRTTREECVDSPGFEQPFYKGPLTHYQRLLRCGMNGEAPNSMRLARHLPETVQRFRSILDKCRRGVGLSDADRRHYGLRKQAITPLASNAPSKTLTTLPDDYIHYSEPRILTVREYARLQSFPDWFEFRGKYTTGGERRKRECPRYTQVGNALPPFVAEVIGRALLRIRKVLK